MKTEHEKWQLAFDKYRDLCEFLLKLDLAGFGVIVTWITVAKYSLWDIGFFAPLIKEYIAVIQGLVLTTFGFDLYFLGMWVAMAHERRISKTLLRVTHIGLVLLVGFHCYVFSYAIGSAFGFLNSTREHMIPRP